MESFQQIKKSADILRSLSAISKQQPFVEDFVEGM
jgi:hypothetical protein